MHTNHDHTGVWGVRMAEWSNGCVASLLLAVLDRVGSSWMGLESGQRRAKDPIKIPDEKFCVLVMLCVFDQESPRLNPRPCILQAPPPPASAR